MRFRKRMKAIILLLILSGFRIYAQWEVFDPTNWLEALEEVYYAYDQVTKTITMIEQNYEQMAFYVERAKSFNFDEIEWDGDLDFRNEIFSATTQINNYLNNIRGIRDAFRKKNIRMGNQSFSFEDLVGLGDENKTIEDLVKESFNVVKNSAQKAAEAFENSLSEEEAAMLWAKYGLTPENYYMVQSVKKQADKAIDLALGAIDEDVVQKKYDSFDQTISNIMDMLGAAGAGQGLTETEIGQIQALLQQQTINALTNLQRALEQGVSYQAWFNALKQQEEDAKKASEERMFQEMDEKVMDPWF